MRAGRWYLVTLLCGLFAIVLLVLGMRGLTLARRVPLPATQASLSRLEAGVSSAARRLERRSDPPQPEHPDAGAPGGGERDSAVLDPRATPSPPPQHGSGAAAAPPGPSAAQARAAETRRRPVNINTATAAELDLLPGVGPVLALRILEYRRTHGPFRRVEDLDQVKGIGPAKLAKMKDHCYAGPAQ